MSTQQQLGAIQTQIAAVQQAALATNQQIKNALGSIRSSDIPERQDIVTIPGDIETRLEAMRWLRQHMAGRYDALTLPNFLAVQFDDLSDAVAFKLAFGGEQ